MLHDAEHTPCPALAADFLAPAYVLRDIPIRNKVSLSGNRLMIRSSVLIAGSFTVPTSLPVIFRKKKPCNRQNRPHNGNPCHRLLQYQHGSHHRYDGNHVNIDAGLDRAKHLYCKVPCDKAECRRPQPKIQDIE